MDGRQFNPLFRGYSREPAMGQCKFEVGQLTVHPFIYFSHNAKHLWLWPSHLANNRGLVRHRLINGGVVSPGPPS